MVDQTKLNSVNFWIKVGAKAGALEDALVFLPLIYLSPATYNAITTMFLSPHYELIKTIALSHSISNIPALMNLAILWIVYGISISVIVRARHLLRFAVIKLMLWRKSSVLTETRKHDERVDAKAKDLIEYVEQKGFTLENPS